MPGEVAGCRSTDETGDRSVRGGSTGGSQSERLAELGHQVTKGLARLKAKIPVRAVS